MALTGKIAQWDGLQHQAEELPALTGERMHRPGWRHQAEHLSRTHTAVGMAAMAVAGQGQARGRPSLTQVTRHLRPVDAEFERGLAENKIELANTLEPAPAKFSEPKKGLARETVTAQILNERMETLAADAVAADERIDGLEGKLRSAREGLAHWENENRSLQTSLDLLVSENNRLSRCLTENDAAGANKRVAELEGELGSARQELVLRENENHSLQASLAVADKARAQFEQMKAALIAAEAELNALALANTETDEKRQIEIDTLHIRLEATSSRAIAAEKLLAEAQQTWLVDIEENSIAARKIADATEAHDVALQKFEPLRDALEANERKVRELEDMRSKLIVGMYTSLTAFKARDTALARAEARIKLLVERVAQLEAEANLANQKKAEEINFPPPCERVERIVADMAGGSAHTNYAEPRRETDDDVSYDGGYSEPLRVRSTETLLAGTVTF